MIFVILNLKLYGSIRKVDKTNKEYKNIQTLSVTLNNVDEELKDNKEKIKTLTENNEALNLRIETLNKNIDKKNNEIKELKEENNKLKQMVIKWNIQRKLLKKIHLEIYKILMNLVKIMTMKEIKMILKCKFNKK